MERFEFEDFDYISYNGYHPEFFNTMNHCNIFVDRDTHQIYYEVKTHKKNDTFENYINFKRVLHEEKVNHLEDKSIHMIAPPLDWLIECAKEFGQKRKLKELEGLKKKIMISYLMNCKPEVEHGEA